jgi:hypothetical protein
LIYPILREAWIPFAQELQLWCHTALNYDEELSGVPDYFVARQSPLGTVLMEKPLLMVMEAKKDDVDWGWGQCLAATRRSLEEVCGASTYSWQATLGPREV